MLTIGISFLSWQLYGGERNSEMVKKTIPERKDIPDDHKWDLTALFNSDQDREMANTPNEIFGQLDNVDLDFGSLEDENGNEIELGYGNFSTFLINRGRDIRKKAFFQYYRAYENHKHTLAAILSHSIKVDMQSPEPVQRALNYFSDLVDRLMDAYRAL
jgi:oligoendopeptidase F